MCCRPALQKSADPRLTEELLLRLHPERSTSSTGSPRSRPTVSPVRQFFQSYVPLRCSSPTLPVSFILLRFKRVDNLGAYRIPPETGRLSGHDAQFVGAKISDSGRNS